MVNPALTFLNLSFRIVLNIYRLHHEKNFTDSWLYVQHKVFGSIIQSFAINFVRVYERKTLVS